MPLHELDRLGMAGLKTFHVVDGEGVIDGNEDCSNVGKGVFYLEVGGEETEKR